MKRVSFLLFPVLFSFLTISGQNAVEKIDSLVEAYYQNGVFNGVVLVSKKGEVIYKKAFGFADREWSIPNTINTKFRIASISKPFTALLVLQLAQEDKINLSGKITDYIPDYKGKLGDNITIHQLLTHTSGILTSLDPEEEAIQERLYHSLRDMIKFTESADLYFRPGTGFRYSNHGYYILAYIIEKVTGKKFGEVLKEKILEPAGMLNTSQSDHSRIERNLARGYEYKLLYGYENASGFDDSYTVGAGGLISTVEDLYLFDKALYSDILISGFFKTMMFAPASPGKYGYGWFINTKKISSGGDSIIVADHSGSINGFGSYMARILSDSSLVVVLKNQRTDTYIDPAFAPDIGNQIISILYGGKIDLPKKSIARHIASLIGTQSIDSAISEYHRVEKNDPGNYLMDESELNRLGIELYFKFKMTDEALKIFEVNMIQFPKSYNTFDSYAYILMQKGDYEASITFYKKGLEVLKKFPEENDIKAVKKDSEQTLVYISEMQEKINKK
ncbi:MAG: serine hydrolase domain-containing protein [Bacteroidota bacterium]